MNATEKLARELSERVKCDDCPMDRVDCKARGLACWEMWVEWAEEAE